MTSSWPYLLVRHGLLSDLFLQKRMVFEKHLIFQKWLSRFLVIYSLLAIFWSFRTHISLCTSWKFPYNFCFGSRAQRRICIILQIRLSIFNCINRRVVEPTSCLFWCRIVETKEPAQSWSTIFLSTSWELAGVVGSPGTFGVLELDA